MQGCQKDDPSRVPPTYLGLAFLQFFSLLLFRGINKLRVFNAPSSPIPTAPTNLLHSQCLIEAFDTARAQTENARISGRVTDLTGAVIVAAQCKITNIETDFSFTNYQRGRNLRPPRLNKRDRPCNPPSFQLERTRQARCARRILQCI